MKWFVPPWEGSSSSAAVHCDAQLDKQQENEVMDVGGLVKVQKNTFETSKEILIIGYNSPYLKHNLLVSVL